MTSLRKQSEENVCTIHRREGEQNIKDEKLPIVRKAKLGLKLKINVCTFNFWVSYVPESVASYRKMRG